MVVFLVNLTSALSLAQLRANLGVVDPGFLLGRACIVATHGAGAHTMGRIVASFAARGSSCHCASSRSFGRSCRMRSGQCGVVRL